MNKLYTFPNCGKCTQTKEFLGKRGVEYEEVNAGIGTGRMDFMAFYKEHKEDIKRENGQVILPILVLESRVVQGFENISSHYQNEN
jgi:glutaredoxin